MYYLTSLPSFAHEPAIDRQEYTATARYLNSLPDRLLDADAKLHNNVLRCFHGRLKIGLNPIKDTEPQVSGRVGFASKVASPT